MSIENNVLSAPGTYHEELSEPLTRSTGAAAAGSVAGAVVLTGVTLMDVEVGLDGTRHDQTLAKIFVSALLRADASCDGVATLTIAVQSSVLN